MAQLMSNLVTASIHGSVVILAVILLRLVLRKTPKKYICLLWLLAGIRLLMPIEIQSDLSLQPEFTLPADFNLPILLPWVWGFVAICFGIYSLVSYMKLKVQVREAVRIRGGWECDKIDTAFILGFIKPRIYIPMGMNRQARKHILEHERTHLDKGDHWIKMIGFLALALHWFNPLVWIAYILLCKDIEMACDERVVQFMELDERKSYSTALLSCSSKQLRFSANPVAFGEVSVKQRILSVLNYKKPSFWISLLGVVAFFFVAVCLLTSPPAPVDRPAAESLTPEQKSQRDMMQKCYQDAALALSKDGFFYEIYASNIKSGVRWYVQLYKHGDNTMWTYTPSSRGAITEGRMEWQGNHYAWQSGNWMTTDTKDSRFEEWLDIFRWDATTTEYVGEEQYENGMGRLFTARWEDTDKTVHTSSIRCGYVLDDSLQSIWIDQPNYANIDAAQLILEPSSVLHDDKKTVADFFAEAEASIVKGMVTAEELVVQAEYDTWGIYLRVDDDRLSGNGADVYFSQDEFGFGIISTTEEYWLEKFEDGQWVEVPVIGLPRWSSEGIGVAKGTSTYGYQDWTSVYGTLEPGKYRLGKEFSCYDRETSYQKTHAFYSEFEILESVDSTSPEARNAVERCYAELEELKQREIIHWVSSTSSDNTAECWINGEDFFEIRYWNGPSGIPREQWSDHDKNLFPREDTTIRYQGVGYSSVRKDPEVLNSTVMGMGVSTLSPYNNGWKWVTFADDFSTSLFERSNHMITFPEGIGVISDEMIRFQREYKRNDGTYVGSAILTFKFDDEGNLYHMEYQSCIDREDVSVFTIEIFYDTAEEIDAKIKSYVENPVVREFSWEEAKAKYTDDAFNIRESNFVNTESNPISGPVDAVRLALKEYPALGEYLSVDAFHDDTAGMWKVTIEAYVDYQATYGYRDVYLTDNGVTCLLVYEGPIGWAETRK